MCDMTVLCELWQCYERFISDKTHQCYNSAMVKKTYECYNSAMTDLLVL